MKQIFTLLVTLSGVLLGGTNFSQASYGFTGKPVGPGNAQPTWKEYVVADMPNTFAARMQELKKKQEAALTTYRGSEQKFGQAQSLLRIPHTDPNYGQAMKNFAIASQEHGLARLKYLTEFNKIQTDMTEAARVFMLPKKFAMTGVFIPFRQISDGIVVKDLGDSHVIRSTMGYIRLPGSQPVSKYSDPLKGDKFYYTCTEPYPGCAIVCPSNACSVDNPWVFMGTFKRQRSF